jgi:hypothetical protein
VQDHRLVPPRVVAEPVDPGDRGYHPGGRAVDGGRLAVDGHPVAVGGHEGHATGLGVDQDAGQHRQLGVAAHGERTESRAAARMARDRVTVVIGFSCVSRRA